MSATKSQSREALLLNLVNALADQPRASMGQLASMVGLSRATLCRYFPSRDAMMLSISEAGITSTEQAFVRACPHEGSAQYGIRRLIEEMLPIAELYAYVDQPMHTDEAKEARLRPLKTSLIALFK